jgi:outer membrane protein OmpA-like peptidoglycan-associated protein
VKTLRYLTLLAGIGSGLSCAATAPTELTQARTAYQRASTGPASKAAPAEVHVAGQALAKAEKSFRDDDDPFKTRDLAYVASRKAMLAEATASIIAQQKTQANAQTDFQATQGKIVDRQQNDLNQTRSALDASQREAAVAADKLAVETAARLAAEQRAATAQAALAKLASVKDEARGLVITLSGSVLFASGKSALLPAARSRLDQVSEVLLTTRERNLLIEGHTDSQGSEGSNVTLSQNRANAVRDYILSRGYGADLVKAVGLGESNPVADNGNAEGRANNRRVEIIIQPLPVAMTGR